MRKKMRLQLHLAEVEAKQIMEVESAACSSLQNWWRHELQQRTAACERKRFVVETKAAIVIQASYRGYRQFVLHVMTTFSAIQIQSVTRGYLAKCHRTRLKQEVPVARHASATAIVSNPQEHIFLRENAAATAIQTCFRGYQVFVRYVITQYFIIKIQAVVRGYQARRLLKQLKRVDKKQLKDRKIQKNRQLASLFTRHRNKVGRAASGSSWAGGLSLSSSKSKSRISSYQDMQKQREKKAALVIERFFINIKAEIELEMRQLEQHQQLVMKKEGEMSPIPSCGSSCGSFHSHLSELTPSIQMGMGAGQTLSHQQLCNLSPHQSVMMNASSSREHSFQSAVHSGGYIPNPVYNQAPMHTSLPPLYGCPPQPNCHPTTTNHNLNHQQHPPYDTYSMQSNSFGSVSYHPISNNIYHQRQHHLPSSHQPMSRTGHHPQYPPSTSSPQRKTVPFVQGGQQTPMEAKLHNNDHAQCWQNQQQQ